MLPMKPVRRPPYTRIPITSHDVLINVWEVFEISEIRTKLEKILESWEDWDAAEAIRAHQSYRNLIYVVHRKAESYRRSINKAAAREGYSLGEDMEDVERFAKTLDIREQAVCHAAMLKVYTLIQTVDAMEKAATKDPVQHMRNVGKDLRRYVLGLFGTQLRYKDQVVEKCRREGYHVEEEELVPIPLLSKDMGPFWEIAEVVHGDPSIPPTGTPVRLDFH
ncbi:hypothetical protein [Luteimonas sp. e5]